VQSSSGFNREPQFPARTRRDAMMTEADCKRTRELIFENADMMAMGKLLDAYPVCRGGKDSWIPLRQLTYPEACCIKEAITDLGRAAASEAAEMEKRSRPFVVKDQPQ
jgi:hypothetical protein